MAPVPVEGPLGAYRPGLEEHPRGVDVSREAGVVEGDGVPAVPGVDVDAAGVEDGAEAGDVAGAGGGEDVPGGDLLEGDGGVEVLRVEVKGLEGGVQRPWAGLRGGHALLSGLGFLGLGL